MSTYSIALITVPDERSAEKVSNALLGARLAACVNQIPGVLSRYRWRGKVERAGELLLLVKTRTSRLKALEKCVRGCHPYEVPEIISLPIVGGYKPYLNWLGESTR